MRHSINDTYEDIMIWVSEDKKKIKVSSCIYGEYEKNLFDELNDFIEYDFSIIYQYKPTLQKIYNDIINSNGSSDDINKYAEFIGIANGIAKRFEEKLPGLYMCLSHLLEDRFSLTEYLNLDLVLSMEEIWNELENIVVMQRDFSHLFYTLSDRQLNAEDRTEILTSEHYVEFVTNIFLSYDYGKFSYQIIANTPTQFYATLNAIYFSTKPLLALCQYCGRYFTPKTKRVTLYCDRVTKNNSTCKKEGAKTKHREKLKGDPVLLKYNREKHRRYMECDRNVLYSGGYSSFEGFYNWDDIARKKLTQYKSGELSAERMIKFLENQI